MSNRCANRARRSGSGQDEGTGVEQHHPDLGGLDVPEASGPGRDEVVELGHGLHIGNPAAGDDEGQQRPTQIGVGLDVGLLQDVDDVVAHALRVPKILEGERVLAQPRADRPGS